MKILRVSGACLCLFFLQGCDTDPLPLPPFGSGGSGGADTSSSSGGTAGSMTASSSSTSSGSGEGGAGVGGAGGEGGAMGTGGSGSGGAGGGGPVCEAAVIDPAYKLTTTVYGGSDPGTPNPNYEANWSELAFDALHGQMVMFGGRSTFAPNGYLPVSTWGWDGTSWSKLADETTSPTPRKGFKMVYDTKNQRILLFGGAGFTATGKRIALNDLWTWNGQAWQLINVPGTLPPARSNHGMTFDSDTGTLLVHGGFGSNTSTVLADMWSYDGNVWTDITSSGTKPAPRAYHAMAYDPVRKRTVVYGGSNSGSNSPPVVDGTWEWDGSAWWNVPHSPFDIKPAGGNIAMVFDKSRQTIVTYGGTDYSGGPDMDEDYRHFTWNGAQWHRILRKGVGIYKYPYDYLANTTSPDLHHWAIAYDDCRNRIVKYRHIPGYSGVDLYETETIGNPNTPPSFNAIPGPVQIYPGDAATITITASDIDSDPLTYSVDPKPTGVTIYTSNSPHLAQMDWTPTVDQQGEYSLEFTVSDGSLNTSMMVPVHVGDITYPDLPLSATINMTFSGPVGVSYCGYEGTDCNHPVAVPGTDCTCVLTGTNPGRVIADCTLDIPSVSWTDSYGMSSPTGGLLMETTSPIKGDSTFRASLPNLSGSYVGAIVSGPMVKVGSFLIDLNGGKYQGLTNTLMLQ